MIKIPEQNLSEFNYNGIRCRVLHLPKRKTSHKRIFVLLHGQHHSIERFYSMAQFLNRYGEVYFPDLPGFGGSPSFYKIRSKPTYANYATYLYDFMDHYNLRKNVWLTGISFGSQVMTKMLLDYRETQQWTTQCVAIAGLVGKSDFKVSRKFKILGFPLMFIASTWIGSKVLETIFNNQIIFNRIIHKRIQRVQELRYETASEIKQATNMEESLWKINDHRTHARTSLSMFTQDLRNHANLPIQVPVHNIASKNDQYFDTARVAEGFSQLYTSYSQDFLALNRHGPSIIASEDEVADMIPAGSKQLLENGV